MLYDDGHLGWITLLQPLGHVHAGVAGVEGNEEMMRARQTVPGHIGLSPFFTFDLHLSWNLSPNKIWKSAPESLVVQPQVAFYNLFNFQNFDPAGNPISGVLQAACFPAPSCVPAGNVVGQTRGSRTNLINPGAASGVNWYGVPRQAEFGVKVTF